MTDPITGTGTDLIPPIEPPPTDPTPTDAGVQPALTDPVEFVAPIPTYRVTTKFDGWNVGDPFPGTDPRVPNLVAMGLIV